jgi:hypothetical protein
MTQAENNLNYLLGRFAFQPMYEMDCYVQDLTYYEILYAVFKKQIISYPLFAEAVLHNIVIDIYEIVTRGDYAVSRKLNTSDVFYTLRDQQLHIADLVDMIMLVPRIDLRDYTPDESGDFVRKGEENIGYEMLLEILAQAITSKYNFLESELNGYLAGLTDEEWLHLIDWDDEDDSEEVLGTLKGAFSKVSSKSIFDNDLLE